MALQLHKPGLQSCCCWMFAESGSVQCGCPATVRLRIASMMLFLHPNSAFYFSFLQRCCNAVSFMFGVCLGFWGMADGVGPGDSFHGIWCAVYLVRIWCASVLASYADLVCLCLSQASGAPSSSTRPWCSPSSVVLAPICLCAPTSSTNGECLLH